MINGKIANLASYVLLRKVGIEGSQVIRALCIFSVRSAP
jgi:hypothetical protein